MKRFLTLMVIPHNDEHVREFNLAPSVIWGGAALVLLFIFAGAWLAYGYYAARGAESVYTDLRSENAQLAEHLDTLQGRMGGLAARVGDLSQADARIRAFARLTEPSAGAVSAALETPHGEDASHHDYASTDGYASLDQLTHEARLLAEGIDSIRAALYRSGDASRYVPSIFPVRGEGWYSSLFGYRTDPITGQRSFNNGVDIAGRKGTPIVATADGRVDAARYHNRLGHMVSIDHTNGIRTVYAHLASHDAVKPGQRVRRGDVIGRMDRSGRTTAVHLHYAVIRDKKAQDPLNYILDNRPRRTLF